MFDLTLDSTTAGLSRTDLAQFLKDILLGAAPCLSQARAAASLARPPFTMEKDFSADCMYEPGTEKCLGDNTVRALSQSVRGIKKVCFLADFA